MIITNRGKPAYVLLTIESYEALMLERELERRRDLTIIVDLIAMPSGADIAFEHARLDGKLFEQAELP